MYISSGSDLYIFFVTLNLFEFKAPSKALHIVYRICFPVFFFLFTPTFKSNLSFKKKKIKKILSN